MTPEEYRRLEELFQPALRMSAPERQKFLDRECAGEAELRRHLEVMLDKVAADSDVLPEGRPHRIGAYRILETLGEGGMGVVYLAAQEEPIQRQVAVKVIRRGMETREVLARFELERQALALMAHPGIAQVFDVGQTEDGRPYFVMEYIAGEPITEFCDRRHLGIDQRLELFVQVCDAVHHAHLKAFIHRDLKPSNIIVSEKEGQPLARVIDFGIAKATDGDPIGSPPVTATNRFVGTPEYTSPEQVGIGAPDVDLRTDVYSLGVVLYEILVGQRPHESPTGTPLNMAGWAHSLLATPARAPSTCISRRTGRHAGIAAARDTTPGPLRRRLRADLDWITLRAVELDRNRRYPSVRDLGEDIRRHLRREPVHAGPPGPGYRIRKLCQRHPGSVLGAAVALLAIVAGGIVAMALYLEAESARVRASTNFENAREALQARDRALLEKERALQRSEGLRLTARALTLSDSEPGVALQLAIEGARRHDGLETRNALYDLLDGFVEHHFLEGHADRLVALAVSPDGQRIATGAGDGETLLWTAGTRRPYALLHGDGPVNHLAFSGSGDRLLTCTRGASVWDASSGREIVRLAGLRTTVRHAAFSPGGERLATALQDGSVSLWDARDGHQLARFDDHDAPAYPVRFSPDGTRLVSGSRDGTARIRDLASGDSLILDHAGATISNAVFRKDGKRVLTSSVGSVVRIWDADSGTLERELLCGTRVVLARYDATGQWVAAACADGVVRVFGADSSVPAQELRVHDGPVTDVVLDTVAGVVYSSSYDKTVGISSLRTGALLARLVGHTDRIQRLALGPEGLLVSASFDRRAALWPDPLRTVFGPLPRELPAILETERIGRDRLATVHQDGSVRLWSATGFEALGSLPGHADRVTEAIADPGGDWLATSSWDGSIRILDPRGGRSIARLGGHEGHVLGLAFSPAAGLLVSRSRDGSARVWSADGWQLLSVLRGHDAPIYKVSICRDGRYVLTVDRDDTARIWSPRDGEELRRVDATVAALSPTGASWSWSSRKGISLEELHAGSAPRLLDSDRQRARDLAFSPRGDLLMAALGNDTSRVWRLPEGQVLWTFEEEQSSPESVGFSPREELAFTLSREGSIRLWSLETGMEETVLQPRGFRPRRVEFDAGGDRLFAVSYGGDLRVWPLTVLPFAESRRPRRLSSREADRFEIGDAAERRLLRITRTRRRQRERLELQEDMIARGAAHRNVFLDMVRTVERLLAGRGDPHETTEYVESLIERCVDRGESVAIPLLISLSAAHRRSGHDDAALLALERAQALPATPTGITERLNRARSKWRHEALTCRSIDARLDLDGIAGAGSIRELAGGRKDTGHLGYLEASLEKRAGRLDRALARASTLLNRGGECELAARLLSAHCHIQRGDPAAAERCLRRGLGSLSVFETELWNEWFRLGSCELRRGPADLLGVLRSEGIERRGGAARNMFWLLERLESGTTLRINCGGERHEDAAGRIWSEDRFFRSGDPIFRSLHGSYHLAGFHGSIEGTGDFELYRDARLFRPAERRAPAYRIPLPPGTYAVTLHFVGTIATPRSFDVLLEGVAVLENYDPRGGRSHPVTDPRVFSVDVEDGFLEIEFRARQLNPYVAAIEIGLP